MAGEYTIKILSSEEFNKLPFKRIMENPGTVFGAADPRTRTAYVRDTGYGDFTKATIGHELDELVAEVSPHEEDGIRYKDFSQSFGNFLGNVPVIGKPLGAVGNLVGGGIDLLGKGASKVGLPSFNIGSPSPASPGPVYGPQTQMQSAISSGINKATQASQPTDFADAWLRGSDAARAASAARTTVPQTQTAANPFSSFISSIGSGAKDLWSGFTGNVPTAAPGGAQLAQSLAQKPTTGQTEQTGDFWTNLGTQASKAAPGTLVSMLGNLFAPKVEGPDYSGIKADLESKIGAGNSPGFDLAFGEAQRILGKDIGVLPDTVLEPIYQRRDQELAALDQQFRLNQQGGQSSLRDATRYGELRSDIIEKYESEIQQLAFQYENQQELNRMNVMGELFDLDQAQYEQYKQLAMFDVATLMDQYGLDVQTATDFKTLFGNIGTRMLDSAFPSSQPITQQTVQT